MTSPWGWDVSSQVEMQRCVEAADSEMRLLVASLRNAAQLSALAAEGCDTFTFSPEVARELLGDPMTAKAARDFEEAAKRMGATP